MYDKYLHDHDADIDCTYSVYRHLIISHMLPSFFLHYTLEIRLIDKTYVPHFIHIFARMWFHLDLFLKYINKAYYAVPASERTNQPRQFSYLMNACPITPCPRIGSKIFYEMVVRLPKGVAPYDKDMHGKDVNVERVKAWTFSNFEFRPATTAEGGEQTLCTV